MISQCGAIYCRSLPIFSAARCQSVCALPSPHVGVNPLAFLISFLRSMPITLGLSLYRFAIYFKQVKNFSSEYYLLHHNPSPSESEQHHCDLLVWLLRYTMSPESVIYLMVSSKICIEVLPSRLGLALISSLRTTLSSQNICNENVSLTTLKSRSSRICLQISRSVRHQSPPTQCRSAWPPDQLTPASLTLRPVASTIFMPLVERGNLISAQLQSGTYCRNYFYFLQQFSMKDLSSVKSMLLPIGLNKIY